MRFIWDYDNITHIAEHNVSPEEAEHALSGPTMPVEYQDWHTEERWTDVGVTSNGRLLLLVTTLRGVEDIRVVTAVDAPQRLAKEYLRTR